MIINSINFIFNNILNIMVYIDLEKIYNFIMINKYLYLFIIITNIIMVFDFRFTYVMKLFIIPLFIIIGTIVLTIINVDDLSYWIKDLFWYTKLLNLSFIMHTCWLSWIYWFFWYYRCEKVCWIVSRISFICSMSFILIILNYLDLYISEILYYKYRNIVHYNGFLTYIYLYFLIILCVIKTIIRFFMAVHGNYSIIFMKSSDLSNFSYERLKSLIKLFLFIMITFIFSYYILGISRLYVVWISLFIYEFISLFYKYIKDYDSVYKDEYSFELRNIFKKYTWLNKYIQFFSVYLCIFYSKHVESLSEDYVVFLYRYIYVSLFTYPQNKFLYINLHNRNFAYADFYEPYKLFFKNRESWIYLCKKELDKKSWTCHKHSERFEIMINFINHDMVNKYKLTELERLSFIKFHTVDYEKMFWNSWVERGYSKEQIEKIWRGEFPF